APRVAIINATMARYYFGDTNAVGKRFGMRRDTGNEIEVVGVVADAATDSVRAMRQRMIYLPYRQDLAHLLGLCLAVRTARVDPGFPNVLRAEIHRMDSTLPVRDITSIDAQLERTLVEERLLAALSGGFGALAIVLTCVGLYGLLAYSTARRTNETGVRLALG